MTLKSNLEKQAENHVAAYGVTFFKYFIGSRKMPYNGPPTTLIPSKSKDLTAGFLFSCGSVALMVLFNHLWSHKKDDKSYGSVVIFLSCTNKNLKIPKGDVVLGLFF
jgi:hypothetical protein